MPTLLVTGTVFGGYPYSLEAAFSQFAEIRFPTIGTETEYLWGELFRNVSSGTVLFHGPNSTGTHLDTILTTTIGYSNRGGDNIHQEFSGFTVDPASVLVADGDGYRLDAGQWLAKATDGDYRVIVKDGLDYVLEPFGQFRFAGNDRMKAGGGNDTFSGGRGDDVIRGQAGRDKLFGDGGSDRLFGGNGTDRLKGGKGDDVLKGGRGDDVLIGNGGDDRLAGQAGDDRLEGGKGSDIFVFGLKGRDVVVDYTDGTDRIQIAAAQGFDDLKIRDGKVGAVVMFEDGRMALKDVAASDLDTGGFIF